MVRGDERDEMEILQLSLKLNFKYSRYSFKIQKDPLKGVSVSSMAMHKANVPRSSRLRFFVTTFLRMCSKTTTIPMAISNASKRKVAKATIGSFKMQPVSLIANINICANRMLMTYHIFLTIGFVRFLLLATIPSLRLESLELHIERKLNTHSI
uniref:Uncharacterized protein n=1 Tax=Glossina austeni TaxID=7395 RepID=A0A1A9UP48_GLOAU